MYDKTNNKDSGTSIKQKEGLDIFIIKIFMLDDKSGEKAVRMQEGEPSKLQAAEKVIKHSVTNRHRHLNSIKTGFHLVIN